MARGRHRKNKNYLVEGDPAHKARHDPKERHKAEDLELAAARRTESLKGQKRHDRSVQSDIFPEQNVWVSSTSLVKDYAIPVHVQLNAENIPSGSFTGQNTYFDIVLNGGNYIGYADHIILELILTNPGAAAITLGPAEQLFDKIELLVNGSNVADTLYPEQMFFGYKQDICDEHRAIVSDNYGWERQTDRDSTLNPYQLTNYDAAVSGTGVVIAAGGQKTYWMEIPCCLSYANLYLPAIGPQKGPRYRFYPSANNCKMSSDATTTKPVIQQAIFVVGGPQFSSDVQDNITSEYHNQRTVVPCIAFDRQIVNISIFDNKETGDLTLNSITGQVAGLMAIVRKVADGSQEGLFSPGGTGTQTWKQFDLITFKESSGRVIGYEKEPMQLYRSLYWSDHFRSTLAQEKCVLWYPFSSNIMSDIKTGSNSGSFQFEGSETFRFTPQNVPTYNTFTDGDNCEFLVYVYRHAVLSFNNGQWNLKKL